MEKLEQYRLDNAEIQKVLIDYIAEKTGVDPAKLTIGVTNDGKNGTLVAYTNTVVSPVSEI